MSSIESRFLEIKASGDLPSPTGVALKILKLSQEEESSLEEIGALLECDPVLAGQLLKIANSVQGSRRPVIAIRDAVKMCGIDVIRQLVLGLSILSHHRKGKCQAFDYPGFWTHSLATAATMRALCASSKTFQPEEAFTFGLLSGIGRLALATVYPVQYAEILRQMGTRPPSDLLRIEEKSFSITHLELTQAMLRDWGLPVMLTNAIDGLYGLDEKRSEPGSRTTQLAQMLYLANVLGSVYTADEDLRPALIPSVVTIAEQIGFDQAAIPAIFNEIAQRWQKSGTLLEVPTTGVSDFSELLERCRHRTPGLNAFLSTTRTKPGLRVLLIDDEPVTLELLKSQLTWEGHQVATAANGAEGLQYIIEFNPQLVISDCMMPEMNGIEFCRALRKTRFGQQIYLIFLTAVESDEQMAEAFQDGADDYLIKPVKPAVLTARICAAERVIRLQEEMEREKTEFHRCVVELASANRRLEQAALTDPLTSLPNRRYATRRLEQVWAAAGREGHPISCMIIDIDHFKTVNDQHGHAVGDAVLREISQVLRSAVRKDDEVCRTGGEEFLIICANTGTHPAQAVAERVRAAVESHFITCSDKALRVTISVGVATQQASESNPDALLRAADMAAYAAKRRGRNRVCVINGIPVASAAA